MIKKITKLLSIFVLMILITGCAKFETTMEINKDKSMDLSIITAVDKNLTQQMTENTDVAEIEKRGFYIEKYIEDGKEGYKLVKQIKNIDDVSTEGDLSKEEMTAGLYGDSEYIFTVKKGFFKTTYKATYDFDISGLSVEDMNISNLKDIGMKFRLKLPYKAITSNATSKSNHGKTLEWDLTKESIVSFEFPMYDMTKIYITIGISILVLLFMIATMMSKKKKKPKLNTKVYDGDTKGFIDQISSEETSNVEEWNRFISYEDVVKEQQVIPQPVVPEPVVKPVSEVIPQPVVPEPVVEPVPEVVPQPVVPEQPVIDLGIPDMIPTPSDNNQ